jgi:hypothetical protein
MKLDRRQTIFAGAAALVSLLDSRCRLAAA